MKNTRQKLVGEKSRKETLPHNVEIATNAIAILRAGAPRFLVDQSTGSGKTFVMRELLERFPLKNVMVLASSREILKQTEGELNVAQHQPNLTYATYIKVAKMKNLPTGLDAIFVDEAHRLGAPVWGKGVKDLINANPSAKIIGFTGTSRRGDGNDVTDSWFNGIGSKLDYIDCWQEGILPIPIFINTFFKIAEDPIDKIQSLLAKRGINISKVKAQEAAKKFNLEWTKINEKESDIIKKHLPKSTQKIIVFFDNINDLTKFKDEVGRWFSRSGFNPTLIEIHSNLRKRERARNYQLAQSLSSQDQLKVILSVNILNEGVHIPGVEAVMFLRRTVSPVVYLQQLGRCMKTGQTSCPVVFDFVGNIDSAGEMTPISSALQNSITSPRRSRISKSKDSYKMVIYEYRKPFEEICEKITKLVSSDTGIYSFIASSDKEMFEEIERLVNIGETWRIFGTRRLRRFVSKLGLSWPNKELEEYLHKMEWKWTFEVSLDQNIPESIRKIYRKGNNYDYSTFEDSIDESWVLANRNNKWNQTHDWLAKIIWDRFQQWKFKLEEKKEKEERIVPRTVRYIYEDKNYDFKNFKPGSYEYGWVNNNRLYNKRRDNFYEVACSIWSRYHSWRLDYGVLPEKLREIHYITKDYSSIELKSPEYSWIVRHKDRDGKKGTYYPIADILWNELQKTKN